MTGQRAYKGLTAETLRTHLAAVNADLANAEEQRAALLKIKAGYENLLALTEKKTAAMSAASGAQHDHVPALLGEIERLRASVSVLEKELDRERGLFPSDGVWLVTHGRRNSQRIAKLGEIPDPIAFAAIARHRDAIAAAVSRSWREYSERGAQAPIDVADAILRALDSAKPTP